MGGVFLLFLRLGMGRLIVSIREGKKQNSMKRLELPPTIRTPRPDEVPNDAEIASAISEAANANIVEGYILHTEIPNDSLYKFYAEVNVDNPRLWSLIESLLSLLPDEISFIFGHIDGEPLFSDYDIKENILNVISPYKKELSQDGFLEFGFIYQDEENLSEIFIKKPKYIQFWGTSLKPFREIMNKFLISETADLNFIDNYPLVTESLKHLFPEYTDTATIITKLKGIFKKED